ncbi:Crp/Fnr family transcriptional regulator [bacterium]|nr:Crp/Fnr family transcriptional regulator [candidate division CSSED10-310 bacterium]
MSNSTGKLRQGQVVTIMACLARQELFSALAETDRRILADRCRLMSCQRRSFLFHEGETAEAAYLLERGRVQLTRQAEDGREVVIRTVLPGQIFAEAILFESAVYPVSAAILSDSRVVRLPRSGLVDLIDQHPGFRIRFIALLMRRQRYLTEKVRALALYDLEERFFRYLTDMYGASRIIRPGITRKDLAAAIGTTPESLSRLLKRLKERQWLCWSKGTIEIAFNPYRLPE